MAYTVTNFKTKKALREALIAGQALHIFQPGPFPLDLPSDENLVYLEGPHYPKPHTWYAQAIVNRAGKITKLRR